MFQSQREDGHVPTPCGWHLHQPALYGRPPERHKLMQSPGDIRNRFLRKDQTKKTNDMVSHWIQRSWIYYPTLLHFSGHGDVWFLHLTSSKLSPVRDSVSWNHSACGFSLHGPIRCHIPTNSRGFCIWYDLCKPKAELHMVENLWYNLDLVQRVKRHSALRL